MSERRLIDTSILSLILKRDTRVVDYLPILSELWVLFHLLPWRNRIAAQKKVVGVPRSAPISHIYSRVMLFHIQMTRFAAGGRCSWRM